MKHTKIPVACIQTRAHDRSNFEEAWPRILAQVDAAGTSGARLIVLPEGTVPSYVLGHEPVPCEQLERAAADVAARARRYGATIVYGGVKLADGRTFNAAIAVGADGRELGYAAKQFLWHFDRRWYAPGSTLEPIDTPLGRLGLLVCADGRIPTIAATLVERGAEMLVMPTAWVTSGRDPQALENLQADVMANVRARENCVPFAVANKCGVELESVAYCGKSALIAADGTFAARAAEREEAIVFGDMEIGHAHASESAVATSDAMRAPGACPPLRIAFTTARATHVARFAALATDADADVLLARSSGTEDGCETTAVVDVTQRGPICGPRGLEFRSVSSEFASPRGLVAARLGGCDLFVWHAEGDAAWHVPLARTRAAELRAYVVVFAEGARAFAVDPDGTVVAGTFEGFHMAAFAYDPARSAATTVAPTTDVLAGLREAERLRALAGLEAPRVPVSG